MGTFLTVVILIICFLLGAVILVQNPKGGGLASGFTGGSQMGGVQRTTDFLEKSTWYLVVALFVTCIFAGIVNGTKDQDENYDETYNQEQTIGLPDASSQGSSLGTSTEELAE